VKDVRSAALVIAASMVWSACASAPRQTEASRRIQANPPAYVEGRVQDERGRPVAGIGVRGIPRASDIPWAPAAVTACDGTFRLALPAPGAYAFYLRWRGMTLITPSPEDPARTEMAIDSGQTARGVTLIFLSELWRPILGSEPSEPPACP
jgi:hypothetical protein